MIWAEVFHDSEFLGRLRILRVWQVVCNSLYESPRVEDDETVIRVEFRFGSMHG